MSDSGVTIEQWTHILLQRMGLPVRTVAVEALIAWAACEGGGVKNSATFNPLNTTRRMPGSTSMNSCGVQAYTSLESGVIATVQTLNLPPYFKIRIGLRGSTDPDAILTEVSHSPWGTHPHWSALSLQKYGAQKLRGPVDTATPVAHPVLSIGMHGEQVRMLQEVLTVRLATAAALDTDGVFGPQTRAAVMRFQQSHHIPADGVCTSVTWRALSPETIGVRHG